MESKPLASPSADNVGVIYADRIPLFDESLMVSELRKGLIVSAGASLQGSVVGRVAHPINMDNAIALMIAVNIQQTCIQTKRDATVGLGFETEEDQKKKQMQQELDSFQHDVALGRAKTPGTPAPPPTEAKKADVPAPPSQDESTPKGGKSKVEEILDPLCEHGFQALLNQVGEDYENTGNGYIEVVRDGTQIVALWHLPAASTFVVKEEKKPFYHFEVDGLNQSTIKMARFGDTEDMRKRTKTSQPEITEVIQFKQPTSICRDYGLPSWLSCVSWLELAQMVMQYNYDYFQNRAVPDLMVLFSGQKIQKEDMDAFKAQIKETVGAGKRHRTIVGSFPSPDLKVQVERLNADNRESFQDLWSTIQLQVVSSHRVPPLLAGVTLPGKMAAANELPNALIAFQTLFVDQHQKVIQQKLGKTLGSTEAGLGLAAG